MVGAISVGVTGVAAGIRSNSSDMRVSFGIARVIHQRPGTVERGWTQILAVPVHYITRGITDAAADAFDARIRAFSFLAARWHGCEFK